MKHIRFSYRVILSFIIILSISLSICIASIFYVRIIGSNLQKLYDHPLTVSNAVRDINIHINAIHRTMKDVASAENDEELIDAVEKVVKSDQAIHRSFSIVKERFLGEHAKLDAAYSVYVAWEPIRKEVIKLKSEGNDDAATRITKGKGARHVELLLEKTKELTDFAQGKADEFYQSTLTNERYSYYVFGLGIFILICIGSICIFWLSNSFTKPINEFIRNIVKIMERDGTLDFDLHRMSEQTIFDTTLAELKSAYDKLKQYNAELDKRVEERTKELSDRQAELRLSNAHIKELNELFKQQNADLATAKAKAEESDRLKSAFLANMSHEIRTPMNAIIGFSSLLDDRDLSEETKIQYIKLINKSGNQLLRLISDIVDLSKIDADQLSIYPAPCNLKSFISAIYQRFRLSVKENGPNLSLHNDVGKEVWIKLDEQRMTQVLSNLLENAFKYTDKGNIELSCKILDKNILFKVKDTGIGISKENQKNIYKRFHQIERTDEKLREGTGLGLSICEALLSLMNGNIDLESGEGAGTTFYVTIPYSPCAPARPGDEDSQQESCNNEGHTIMVVEDEYTNRILLSTILEKDHFNVVSANNGLDAVRTLQKGTKPDLILMDLKMPEMDGYEALKHIRKIYPEIPVIAQTAYAMANDRNKVIEAGFSDYISKPISKEILIDKIETTLNI